MGNLIDQFLSSNTRLQAFVVALVLAHIIAAFWTWRRGNLIPVLALNVAFAALILSYHLPRLAMSIASQDAAVLTLLAFEALGGIACVIALCGWAMPRFLVWLVFAGNALISVAFTVFVFTFRIGKLF